MSGQHLDEVIFAQSELIAALDARNLAAIEAATDRLASALPAQRAAGAWHSQSENRCAVEHAISQAAAARTRVNFLANEARERVRRLAAVRSGSDHPLYTRQAQLLATAAGR